MMAGYHGVKEKEHSNMREDLASSKDPKMKTFAKEHDDAMVHHMRLSEFHGKEAKKLHKPEIHGHWNDSIPKNSEAIEYSEKLKQSESSNRSKKS